MKNNRSQRRTSIILGAALAAISTVAFSRLAAAQYPAAGQNGHAQDANNRVGSGGYNTGHAGGSGVTANDVVDRNVTGGRSFAGPLGERDPRAFTGPAPGLIDQFNRQSNAPPTDNPGNSAQPSTYYGDNRNVAPPSGSVSMGFNGGYIGTTINSPASLSNANNYTPDDQGLQNRTLDRETLLITQALKTPQYANIINDFNQNGTLTVGPGNGLQNIPNGTGNFGPLALPDVNPDTLSIMRMRAELRESAAPGINNIPNNPNLPNGTQVNPNSPNGQPTPQPIGLNQPLNQPLGQAFDAPANAAISSRITDGQLPSGQLSSTGIISPTASLLPAPAEQSSLLKTLQKRLEASGEVGKALAAEESTTQKPVPVKPKVKAPAPDQAPVSVSSLAEGVKAKGLHDLLANAEDLIPKGKYDSAIQEYNQAFRVAPNNPLPILGRANAELAGGYYARAAMDLQLIFRTDPELLMAQFDLKAIFAKERLDFIRKDLHDLTQSDPKSERPWFLLAYIDYNTGNAAAADKELSEAEQRAGRGDWTVKLLREHWVLPSNPKPAPLTPRPASPAAPAGNVPSPETTTPAPAPAPAVTPAPAPALNK
ncbi:MAG TPA: tetratricopeptide repeat protein [Tepidisphaeraceae bacterium]|jgi:tetratricopeptide (TPR) repeat protein|nr:tetratricopeptide repeat protein [Tepidisphaeraceae bacterium]